MSHEVTFSDALGVYSVCMFFSVVSLLLMFIMFIYNGQYTAGFLYLLSTFIVLLFPAYTQAYLIAGMGCAKASKLKPVGT